MRDAPDHEVLDERTQLILTAVIQSFIQLAEPVGSRTISKRFAVGLSPATIRNVMSDLEELGFLEQPHTSAGRVPTDKGYRFYVDHLRGKEMLSPADSAFISQHYTPYRGEADEVMLATSRLLSAISRYAGIVLHAFSTTVFKRIEFVHIRSRQVLAIFVMASGMVQNKLITLDDDMSPEELGHISNYLNREFSGQTLRAIRQQVLERIQEEKAQYDTLMQHAISVSEKTFVDVADNGGDIYLGGTVNILDQPEFSSNVEQMKHLFKTFEEKGRLIHILDKCLEDPGLNVVIGSETPFEDIRECSLVIHPYTSGDQTIGVLGVVGPKRMDYPRIMAIVDYTATLLSKTLAEG